jgi:secreted trypsin-like serine protease
MRCVPTADPTRRPRLALALVAAAVLALGGAQGAAAKGKGAGAGASIVGGSTAEPANWQFAIALFGLERGRERFRCGGSVIGPTKVLTAAHCVSGFPADRLSVVAGRFRLPDTASGERIEVASYAIHPDYRDYTTRNDVAVITLASPTSQAPIALPTFPEASAATTVGSRLRVAGWGSVDPFGLFRPKGLRLKKANQRVRFASRCIRGFTLHLYDPRLMICAQGKRAPRWSRITRLLRRFIGGRILTSPCKGDSGGPLVADTPGGPRIVGIVSFGGIACGARRFPAVYTRVAEFLAFIAGA